MLLGHGALQDTDDVKLAALLVDLSSQETHLSWHIEGQCQLLQWEKPGSHLASVQHLIRKSMQLGE